jgi:hypothetical protein
VKPQNELAVVLWVVAGLLATFLLTLWFFERLYS